MSFHGCHGDCVYRLLIGLLSLGWCHGQGLMCCVFGQRVDSKYKLPGELLWSARDRRNPALAASSTKCIASLLPTPPPRHLGARQPITNPYLFGFSAWFLTSMLLYLDGQWSQQDFNMYGQDYGQHIQGYGLHNQSSGQPSQAYGQQGQAYGQQSQGYGQPDLGVMNPG